MRVLQALTALLLPLTALAAKKPTTDRFQNFHSKQLSAAGPLKLDDDSYNQLTKAPRDYSVAVLLTALEARFGCGLCQEFQPEWELLGRSWAKGDKAGESRLVFGTLDFVNGKQTFQSVCINTRAGLWNAEWLTEPVLADAPNRTRLASLPPNYGPEREARWPTVPL